jgi:putative transcriptional regulator
VEVAVSVRFRLRELLDERGMTQTELQTQSGLAYSTINDLCNNKPRRIELETIDVLCEVLRCDIADLFERIADRKRSRA